MRIQRLYNLLLPIFICGFMFEPREAHDTVPAKKELPMERVTGIGGVFFKAHDPKGMAAWYAEHLGIQVNHG